MRALVLCVSLRRFDHRGWYDRRALSFQEIVDVGMVAAMGPPGGGRSEISARLMRHYSILAYDELQTASIKTIFTTMNQHSFQAFPKDIQVPALLAQSFVTHQMFCSSTDGIS